MNVIKARVRHRNTDETPQQPHLACATCQAYEFNLCQAVAAAEWDPAHASPIKIHQSVHTAPARRIIFREHDLNDAVPIICEGWAISVTMLSDGSRQILSFLLPGDLVSVASLFSSRPNCLVEAITDVRYRAFKRSELKEILFSHPDLLEKFLDVWSEKKMRANQLIADLGRRTADERIARLILNLAERLVQRGMVQPETMEMDFPLRQHHIADATGLTPVHVSKVLSEFRRRGLIRISDRSLIIVDQAGFRRVAHMR